jgi:hypothetical protein
LDGLRNTGITDRASGRWRPSFLTGASGEPNGTQLAGY